MFQVSFVAFVVILCANLSLAQKPNLERQEFLISFSSDKISKVVDIKTGRLFEHKKFLINFGKQTEVKEFSQKIEAAGLSILVDTQKLLVNDREQSTYLYNVTKFRTNVTENGMKRLFTSAANTTDYNMTLVLAPGTGAQMVQKPIKIYHPVKCIRPVVCNRDNFVSEKIEVRVYSLSNYRLMINEVLTTRLREEPEVKVEEYKIHAHIENGIPTEADKVLIKQYAQTAIESHFMNNKFHLRDMVITIEKRPVAISFEKETPIDILAMQRTFKSFTNATVEVKVTKYYRANIEESKLQRMKAKLEAKVEKEPLDNLQTTIKPLLERFMHELTVAIYNRVNPADYKVFKREYRSGESVITVSNDDKYRSDEVTTLHKILPSSIHVSAEINQNKTVDTRHYSAELDIDANVITTTPNKNNGQYKLFIEGPEGRVITKEENAWLIDQFYKDNRYKVEYVNIIFVYIHNGASFNLRITEAHKDIPNKNKK